MPWHPVVRSVAGVPEHEESLDAIDRLHDRRDAWVAIAITAVAFSVMIVASLLVVLSGRG
jgi:hypothetical protein